MSYEQGSFRLWEGKRYIERRRQMIHDRNGRRRGCRACQPDQAFLRRKQYVSKEHAPVLDAPMTAIGTSMRNCGVPLVPNKV
jgi:hypothetical protein